MSTIKSPGKGTEIKFNVSITPSVADYTMDDFDFVVEFYGNSGRVSVEKDDCIRVDEDNYLAIVDTDTTGCGTLDAKVTAYIPDDDCEDGLRTEVVIISGIDTVY